MMNNYSSIDSEGSNGDLRSEVAACSEHCIPQRQDKDDKPRFFQSEGRDIVQLIVLSMAQRGEEVTLPKIRSMLMSDLLSAASTSLGGASK